MTEPVVQIGKGLVKGVQSKDYLDENFLSFFGIPYAKPPIGNLRFKAPVEAEPWIGVLDCTKPGPACPSKHLFLNNFTGKENNCLNLNVYTKKLPSEGQSLKPVMVWIHGGGFLTGSNKPKLFGPNYLISQDIVLVTINYRLGVLGFLSLEDPSLGVPGNAGLKDMVMALKWIKKYIEKFNGDPNNVTIFGQSAGAAAVHYLYLSPMAKGLFHKAIAQSGCVLNHWARSKHNSQHIAKGLGYNESDEKKILKFIQTVSAKSLVAAQHNHKIVMTASMVLPYGPVIERETNEPAFLSEHPKEIMKKGTFNQVPLIMGYTSKEGILSNLHKKTNYEVWNYFEYEIPYEIKELNPNVDIKEIANKIKIFYYGQEEPSEATLDQHLLLKSDNDFIYGIHESIELQKKNSDQPIYFYKMSLETSINFYKNIALSKNLLLASLYLVAAYKNVGKKFFMRKFKQIPINKIFGVCHADDTGYLLTSFMTKKYKEGSLEITSIRRFVKLWTNFAKTGNPTPDSCDPLLNVEWKPVNDKDNNYLDIEKVLKCAKNPDSDRIKFWKSISE